jgi:GxxExxY protein
LWNLCGSLCYSCCTERHQEGTEARKEKLISIDYKAVKLDHGNKIDLLTEEKVAVEIKTVEAFNDVRTTVFKM